MVRPAGDDWHSIQFKITDDSGACYVDSPLWGKEPQKHLLSPGRYEVVAQQGSAAATTQMIEVTRESLDLRVP